MDESGIDIFSGIPQLLNRSPEVVSKEPASVVVDHPNRYLSALQSINV